MVDPLATWLATYAFHGAVLVVLAALLERVLPIPPQVRARMWTLTFLGALATSAWVTLAPRSPEDRMSAGLEEPLWVPEGGPARRLTVRAEMAEVSGVCRAALRAAPGRDSTGIERACQATNRPDPGQVLVLIWALGALVGLVREGRRRREVAALAERLLPAGPREWTFLTELGARLGSGSVRLAVSPDLTTPAVLPGRVIALPPRCVQELGDVELRAVLAHELGHVARADVAWSGALRWLASLLWIQPLSVPALSARGEAAEQACDDLAAQALGGGLDLARSLTRVASWQGLTPQTGLVAMLGRRGTLGRRVERLTRGRRRTREAPWTRWVAWVAMAGTGAWLPAVPGFQRVALLVFVDQRDVASSAEAGGIASSAEAQPDFAAEEVHRAVVLVRRLED